MGEHLPQGEIHALANARNGRGGPVIGAMLLSLAAAGVLLGIVQVAALCRHLSEPLREPGEFPFISILKPLCGVDDDPWGNLRSFTNLRYPAYEILLGVKDTRDPAYAVAVQAAKRWPHLVRVVLQRSSPGLNPKVNQLITLASAARGEVLVVSDSNIRVRPDYLRVIAAAFEDRDVALVTHPVGGIGARTAGALLDNLIMCGSIAPGVTSAKRIAGVDFVVGKSMALRRSDLRAMGGFERLKDVLAEDFLSGWIVTRELGKKVALAAQPVFNVCRSQRVRACFSRYLRWSVMQRKAVGNVAYAAQIFLNPVALVTAALLASPDRWTALGAAIVVLARSGLCECSARALRGRGFSLLCLFVPLGDLLVACAWAVGLIRNEISWRGNRLAVHEGTRLERVAATYAEPQVGLG
ncbi:MAG: glycosyl transferase [Deltaproteobacteria bacterium]|nr:MAG: glycosyl transferase [Deltaproteobacteria bacterium]